MKENTPVGTLQRDLADALVPVVCRCGPPRHERGYPECETARRAARVALDMIYPDILAHRIALEFVRRPVMPMGRDSLYNSLRETAIAVLERELTQ